MLQIPSDSASIVAPENLMDYCLPLLSRSSFLVGPSLSYQLMGSSEQWRYSVSTPRCQMLASLPPLHSLGIKTLYVPASHSGHYVSSPSVLVNVDLML